MKAQTYTTKPRSVKALQWNGTTDSAAAIREFLQLNTNDCKVLHTILGGVQPGESREAEVTTHLRIVTGEGIRVMYIGNYILSDNGGLFVMTREDFEQQYEPAADGVNPIARAISTVMQEVLEKMPSDLKADNERLRTMVTELQQKVYELEKKNPPSDT